mmetsp:Transcript_51615/g.122197  ORF Transcript_51615/g.122197 Transcript_51615/m.122197 type:complete len:237 (+) Transcript_51615:54-764(+)
MKTTTETSMASGMVTNHAIAMRPSTTMLTLPVFWHFCTIPIPTTAPTRQCEVETGSPKAEEVSTAIAPAICVAKLLLGVSSVILFPTVWIVSRPMVTIPIRNPAAPNTSAHIGTSGLSDTWLCRTTSRIAARGPIAFPTSFPPCAHATLKADTISSGTNFFSASARFSASSSSSPADAGSTSMCTSPSVEMRSSAWRVWGGCFIASRCSRRCSSPCGWLTHCLTFSASTLFPCSPS